MSRTNEQSSFTRKVWITTSIVALFVLLIWIVKTIFNVLLLLFAGALIAIYFVGLAKLLQRKLQWNYGLCIAISIIGSLLLMLGFFWFAGNSIAAQAAEFKEVLPSAIENVKGRLSQSAIGRRVLETASSEDVSSKASGIAQTFFQSTFGVLGDIYIVLFLGIFFTASPKSYTGGLMQLVPPAGKKKAESIISQLGFSLSRWLKGQIFAMFVVFFLTAIGLLIMGIPLWLVLSIIAGLLNFIPNFGPLIAMVPAILIGFLQGPVTALIVAGLYILVQTLESSLITPQIQKKDVVGTAGTDHHCPIDNGCAYRWLGPDTGHTVNGCADGAGKRAVYFRAVISGTNLTCCLLKLTLSPHLLVHQVKNPAPIKKKAKSNQSNVKRGDSLENTHSEIRLT